MIEISKPTYQESLLEFDKEYVLKKLGFTKLNFEKYMLSERNFHSNYYNVYPPLKNDKNFFSNIKTIVATPKRWFFKIWN